MVIKRVTMILYGCALAGLFILGCEKISYDPDPYLRENRTQLVTTSGQTFQLNSLKRIAINDGGIYVVVNKPGAENGEEIVGIDIAAVGKITFK